MELREPQHLGFSTDLLDNFADLAKRTTVKQRGLFAQPLDFQFISEVKLDSMDDLVLAVEQDYYLNRLVTPKFHYIHSDNDLLTATLRLTEIYLTASSQSGNDAEKAKRFALSNLNLI